jgi:putative lipoic acid-binding regulatory protein
MLDDNSGNGGGINYPLSFQLRVIMRLEESTDKTRIHLENLLLKANVGFSSWNTRETSGGKYIRFAVKVTIKNREMMQRLYQDLDKDPAVKAAI